jgi:hypothetical protein
VCGELTISDATCRLDAEPVGQRTWQKEFSTAKAEDLRY